MPEQQPLNEDQRRKLEEMIELFSKGKLTHNLKPWPSLEEKEKALFEKVKAYQRIHSRKTTVLIGGLLFICICLTGALLYLYFRPNSETVTYAILSGSVRELKIPNGNLIINSNSQVELNNSDSTLKLIRGEVLVRKADNKGKFTVKTPDNSSVVIVAGSANVLSIEKYDRVTSLGSLFVITGKDTTALSYGQELRRDSSNTYLWDLKTPELAGRSSKGQIPFENEPLEFVLKRLEDQFGITIKYKTLPKIRITLVVDRSEGPVIALKKIIPDGWTIESIAERSFLIGPVRAEKQ